jgi:polysaccharide deacetylase 2 family uncharacterized protein YibQ
MEEILNASVKSAHNQSNSIQIQHIRPESIKALRKSTSSSNQKNPSPFNTPSLFNS